MKKHLITIAGIMVVLLSACAKERTTSIQSLKGIQQEPPGTDTMILVNDDAKKQEEDRQKIRKNIHSVIKPGADEKSESAYLLKDFSQEELASIYEAMEVEAQEVAAPEGVYEFIGTQRLQKSIGRLTCERHQPLPEALKNSITYACVIDLRNSHELSLSDQELFGNLKIEEQEDPHGYVNYRTFVKRVGHFYCDKAIHNHTFKVIYRCTIEIPMATGTEESSPNNEEPAPNDAPAIPELATPPYFGN